MPVFPSWELGILYHRPGCTMFAPCNCIASNEFEEFETINLMQSRSIR